MISHRSCSSLSGAGASVLGAYYKNPAGENRLGLPDQRMPRPQYSLPRTDSTYYNTY